MLAGDYAGWTVPLDYSPVTALMQSLRIGPYEVLRETSLVALRRGVITLDDVHNF